MKSKSLKTLQKTTQKKIGSAIGPPGKREGYDGDVAFRWIKGRGLFLFYKF